MLDLDSVERLEKLDDNINRRPIHRIANELGNIIEDYDLYDEPVEFKPTRNDNYFQLVAKSPMLEIVTTLQFRTDGRLENVASELSITWMILPDDTLGLSARAIQTIKDRLQSLSELPVKY